MARHIIPHSVLIILSTFMVGCLGSSFDTTFQTELLEKINSLEEQGRQHAEKMHAMESRFEDQERNYNNRLADLERRLAFQEKTTSDYKKITTDLEHRLAVQEKTISDYKQRVVDLEQTVTELKRKHDLDVVGDKVVSGSKRSSGIDRLGRSRNSANRSDSNLIRRALLNAEGPVAFHAVIKASNVNHLGVNQNVVFPDILTNLGGGYHNQHGVFIAPQPGVYIFSVSIMAYDIANHPELYVNLKKNGQTLANAYARGDSGRLDQGSVTVVTQLAAADEIWVNLYGPADTSTYGNYYDSFMGCLVIPL